MSKYLTQKLISRSRGVDFQGPGRCRHETARLASACGVELGLGGGRVSVRLRDVRLADGFGFDAEGAKDVHVGVFVARADRHEVTAIAGFGMGRGFNRAFTADRDAVTYGFGTSLAEHVPQSRILDAGHLPAGTTLAFG